MLLGLDIGTTHIKAGLFELNCTRVAFASRPNVQQSTAEGVVYDPEILWNTVVDLIYEVCSRTYREGREGPITAAGIASMAESGLLVNRSTGAARTPLYAWFNRHAESQAEKLQNEVNLESRFRKSGIRPTFKCSLAKLLWMRDRQPEILDGSVWLSAADYIAYRDQPEGIRDWFRQNRGAPVLAGTLPFWRENCAKIVTVYIPDSDGVVRPGAY